MLGCAEYKVPGPGADFHAMGIALNPASDEVHGPQAKPTTTFPASIAYARVQGPVYQDNSSQTYGIGIYTVVMTHDVEKPDTLQRLAAMRSVTKVEPINKLHLQQSLASAQQLRDAAVGMNSNMLLIYTFDDTVRDSDDSPPLTILTIGILETKKITLTSTASAVLMDPKTGFVYGATEITDEKTATSNAWGEAAAGEATRQEVETSAFDKLTGQVEKTWGGVLTQYAGPTAVSGK